MPHASRRRENIDQTTLGLLVLGLIFLVCMHKLSEVVRQIEKSRARLVVLEYRTVDCVADLHLSGNVLDYCRG